MIKRYREERGRTLEDVALAVGLTFGAVSQWENGRTHPRRAVAFKLDDFLEAGGELVAALGYARPTVTAGPVTNADLLRVLEGLKVAVDDNQWMLRQIAKSRGIPLRARSKPAPSPRALNAGRRKADRP